MTAEAAIHEHWSAYRPLTNLVPAERVFTGLPPLRDENEQPIGFPYVSLLVQGESEVVRTSGRIVLAIERLRFAVFDSSYDRARRIEAALSAYFNRRDFRWSGGKVLDMKPDGRTEQQDAGDGVWQVARDFSVRISQSPQGILV